MSAARFRLTETGRAAAEATRGFEERLARETIERQHERFLTVNDSFKKAVTAWQTRSRDGGVVVNDHRDEGYDARILRRFEFLHNEILKLVGTITAVLPRFVLYEERFSAALASIHGGDHRYVASPVLDSFHTVWFELHEEIILLSGRNRSDEAAAGRA